MHGLWREWIETTRTLAPGYLHLHGTVHQDRCVSEFSRYDAGWLHAFPSRNGGDLTRCDWDDLNMPARVATLAAAGLPLLQRDNAGNIVATQSLVHELDLGLFFTEVEELGVKLRDEQRLDAVRESVWRQRDRFTFDFHADALLAFFREVSAARG